MDRVGREREREERKKGGKNQHRKMKRESEREREREREREYGRWSRRYNFHSNAANRREEEEIKLNMENRPQQSQRPFFQIRCM